jgi:hypothetical protein
MSETQEQVLNRILLDLRSEDSSVRLAAMHELEKLSYSSMAILERLECMALQDPQPAARLIAFSLLSSRTHRYIRSRISKLPENTRSLILSEIQTWHDQGLMETRLADVLRRRYDFDRALPAPLPESPAPAAASAAAGTQAATPGPTPPPARLEPAPTLTQRFLSQSTVNVFLYLGAFLVIGAALILAALVEAARLPILSGVAVVFAASAVLLKKRLPQPSFALFIVFSFLLPILARVLSESLPFEGVQDSIYWSVVFLLMAAIWAASVWFYSSRLFSVISFLSLGLAANSFVRIFVRLDEWTILGLAVCMLAGLAGAALLRRWKDEKFPLPLLITVHLAQLALLTVSVSLLIDRLSFSPRRMGVGDWLAVTLTWLLAAIFYFWNTQLYKFPLFPWAGAAALLPAVWFFPAIFKAQEAGYTAIYGAWGLAMAAASEILFRRASGRLRLASLPLLFAAVIAFVSASIAGLIDGPELGLSALAGAAVVCTVLHILRPRKPVWTTALLFAVAAYFAFFALPMFKDVDIPGGYLWLGIGLLLTLPELFMKDPAGWRSPWRQPLIVLGFIFIFGHVLSQVSFPEGNPPISVISFGVYAALALAYAIHFRRVVMLYFATAFTALALFFALWPIRGDLWLPVFTGLVMAYYLGGLALRLRPGLQAWASCLRISALALGTVVVAAALIAFTTAGALYAVVVAVLFFTELYLRPDDRLEPAAPLLLSAAAILALPHESAEDRIVLLVVIGLLWVACDALYARTLKQRRLAIFTRAAAAAMILVSSLNMLISPAARGVIALGFAVYAAFAIFDAWLYRLPALGYAAASFLSLSVFFALRAAGQENWLYAIMALAVLYYAAGFVLRRRGQLPRWSEMLLYSGLELGTLNALTAPLQTGLSTSIPVAVAATLFALEAFARSNVWLGFPANLLYLEAYFLILVSLKVDEPQFYSVGAALLGILMHYLLTRAGSKLGAFLTGMFSQLVLLGTTYIQLVSTDRLGFFVVIFLQGLVTLGYGIVIRSRSLLITPVIFIVLSVITVVYGALKGISTVILIGCTGILLLMLGILAVVLRERLVKFGDRWSSWRA